MIEIQEGLAHGSGGTLPDRTGHMEMIEMQEGLSSESGWPLPDRVDHMEMEDIVSWFLSPSPCLGGLGICGRPIEPPC